MLPNNLADWPQRPRRVSGSVGLVGRVALLLVLGGLVGFGVYRLGVGFDEPSSPPPPSLATTPLDDAAPPDVATSTPEDSSAPALVVTGLLGNQAESQNWSGYAATEGRYTAVRATWTVPDIGLGSPAGVDAAWVGIGGVRSPDLIQAGTQRTVLQNGSTQQEAWVELLPRAPETVPLPVGAGDTISVSIDQQGPEMWLIAFTNSTSGNTYQLSKHYASSLSSVEWVEEAPSAGRRRTLPLDNFGTVRFTDAMTVRETQLLNVAQSGAHAITMITPGGVPLAEPSRLGADGASFSVTRTSTPSPGPAPRRR